MNYKYQRNQIFGKRLKIPKNILNKVYGCTLSFDEFIEYELDDKIPISCIIESDRKIVEKFGIDKCKELDWELIKEKAVFFRKEINIIDILMSIDSQVDDINNTLYDLLKDKIKPSDYSKKMKDKYSDRLFILSESMDNDNLYYKKYNFNSGRVSLVELIDDWELYKDKDLSYCLLNDEKNIFQITDDQLKSFMNSFSNIYKLLIHTTDIYTFIHEINEQKDDNKRNDYIKKYTDYILNNKGMMVKNLDIPEFSNEQYKEIFEYSSFNSYVEKIDNYYGKKISEELKLLPKDYLRNIPIPISFLFNLDVLRFIGTYGLKNVVDFDNECGHFFTKNNCKILTSMYDMYMQYANNIHDPQKTIFTINNHDENGNYVERPYTQDEFYEAIRRMIKYDHRNETPDYREIIGKFREKNKDLFISVQAPDELKKLFYKKSITPKLLLEHPEFIQYLKGKNLESCFKFRDIKVERSNSSAYYENFYNFLMMKSNFHDVINFITKYSDVLDSVFNIKWCYGYQYEIKFSENDNMSEIEKRINESFRKLIIEKRLVYPKIIPQNLMNDYPSMFLSSEAPKELRDVFYNRTINSDFILSNPTYRSYLKDIDLEVIYQYMPVDFVGDNKGCRQKNLISAIKQTFGEENALDVMLLYGKYIEAIFEINKLQDFEYNSNFSKDDLLDELDSNILRTIIDGKIKYDESIPSHFKNTNPTLFLSESISQDLRNKFYNREFTLNDFNSNPKLLDVFGNTNVVCGFSEDLAWLIPLFKEYDNLKKANFNRLKVISAYLKIQDVTIQNAFKEYIVKFHNNIEVEKIEYLSEVLRRVSMSNSSEIVTFRQELAKQLLNSANPLESLKKIEDVFIKNNLPIVGKVYSCFEILHPNFEGFDFASNISPVLKKSSTMGKKAIIFSDLIKASFGSNNRSINNYLKNIEIGSNLYESMKKGEVKYDNLTDIEKNELLIFGKHLETLYNNTMKSKNEKFISTGDVLTDIINLSKKLSPNGTLDYNLADRVIRMFCGFAGINTLEEAKWYINSKVTLANTRNMIASESNMVLEKGDFVKGIGDITYLENILQNGSVSKEYLGSSAGSDATPLDTDVSMITNSEGDVSQKIINTKANSYGPIWFVLKNDDRFITTRTNDENIDVKNDMNKLEVFYTGFLGKDHYGIRTGFASSEINYIVMENYDPRVGLEIACNGFYIPVANTQGKIVFTPNDYDEIRKKMNGLSYYGIDEYKVDDSLYRNSSEIYDIVKDIENNKKETEKKSVLIKEQIQSGLSNLGLNIKEKCDLNLNSVVLFNTGSTGRFTNLPGDGDYDYTMQVDRNIYSSEEGMDKIREEIITSLGNNCSVVNGDIRELKTTVLDENGNMYSVEIDITFTQKTDKAEYASDVCVSDRLNNINTEQDRNLIMANIILTKKFLKEIEAYKPARKFPEQGGMGGIGVENWILQNGETLYSAAKSFMDAANKCRSFEEFKLKYSLPNFGYNHMALKKGFYPHDDYIKNMNSTGYEKMKKALNIYLKKYEDNIDNPVFETIEEIKNSEIENNVSEEIVNSVKRV